MNKNSIIVVTNFLIFVGLQVLVFKNFVLFDVGFSFVYLIFLLLLPLEVGYLTVMLLGFGTGLLVDVFYNTLGIHAAASVLLCFLRPFWANVVTPRSGYEVGVLPSLRAFGIGWFLTYSAPLIIIHHAAVFFLEAGGTSLIGQTLLKTLASSVFSLVFIISIQYLFFSNRR